MAEQDDTPDYKATFKHGEAGYTVNDVTNAMGVAAFVENGCTYVPFLYLGYALGVTENNVTWDAATKTMDVAPLIRDNRIFLPARYVAQDFGYLVER